MRIFRHGGDSGDEGLRLQGALGTGRDRRDASRRAPLFRAATARGTRSTEHCTNIREAKGAMPSQEAKSLRDASEALRRSWR
jgi:hypothetical protein